MSDTTTGQTFAIDSSHSMVEFVVRHLVISRVRGQFKKVSGTIVVGDGSIPSAIDVEIDPSSIDTREEKRDGHLKSPDFFHVEQFPALTFKSTGVARKDDKHFTVTGDLTMHGTTKSIAFDGTVDGRITDPWGKDRAAYTASTKINRKDFGLTWNQALETGGVMVGEEVEIDLTIEAVAV